MACCVSWRPLKRGNEKVITTRWVCSAKTERVEGKERHIVRCRVVARDFAQGCSAAQLGISSPTSSAEALRTFLCLSATKRWNIVGLDVSAAFLFADLEEDGRVLVTLPDGVKGKGGRKGYLRLRKALYGLRVAAQQWARHLAKKLRELCGLTPCETEPCLFSGVIDGERVAVLAYVDDLLITGESDATIYKVIERLKSVVKIKVTADLNRDRITTFFGRQIQRSSPQESLSFGMDASYYQEVYDEFGLSKTVKPSAIPPNVRDLYDREDPALDKPLSVEACQRYRSTLGKLSWLAMTRVDLAY